MNKASREAQQNDARRWSEEYDAQVGDEAPRLNRSGIEIKPLYTPDDWNGAQFDDRLGYPGQPPATRGVYASMHRGRPWSQRQLIGYSTPPEYNQRLRNMIDAGVTAVSLIPCNSVYRGFDIDEVDIELVGTCGVTVNTIEDMEICLDGIPLDRMSVSLNDPSPFTLLGFVAALARRRGVPWSAITGTSNQSDYISHFVANHMFYRLSLPGSRRVLLDHIKFCNQHMSGWNPVSVVGQHMQQAGATPAEAVGFTLSTAIQYANDCISIGLDPDSFLPRFTFFFDISISMFEEIAKFRAARRIWSRITRETFGAKDPRSWRFKVHGQSAGSDLTRQQPLNNIARVTLQALSGVLGGLQSLHTDGYDEVLSVPAEGAARVAVATQNILREEAGAADVIDPLGGSYYVEALTDRMEETILAVMRRVEDAGGMYAAVESGLVQGMIGDSAMAFQNRVDSGEQSMVGLNVYQIEEENLAGVGLSGPDRSVIEAQVDRVKSFRANRSKSAARQALDTLRAAANDDSQNIFEQVVEAADAGATHGEICTVLREELGYGHPLVMA
jgi:methylmalonyl-CoA mutase, N-terminal domain